MVADCRICIPVCTACMPCRRACGRCAALRRRRSRARRSRSAMALAACSRRPARSSSATRRRESVMSESLFTGLKVIDCASWIAGPAAATILSDFGADVIKIEPPGAGDPWRARGPIPGKDVDYYWQLTARNKRSLAIDLKHPDGIAALHRLVASADVFVTNFPL